MVGSGENKEMVIDGGNACYRPSFLFDQGTGTGRSIGDRRNISLARDGGKSNVVVVDDGDDDTLYDEVGEARDYMYPSFVNSVLVIQYRRCRHVWPDDHSLVHQ